MIVFNVLLLSLMILATNGYGAGRHSHNHHEHSNGYRQNNQNNNRNQFSLNELQIFYRQHLNYLHNSVTTMVPESGFYFGPASAISEWLFYNKLPRYSQEDATKIDLVLTTLNAANPDNEFVKRYFNGQSWYWLGNFCASNIATASPSTATDVEIFAESTGATLYNSCKADFFTDNVDSKIRRTCTISAECNAAVLSSPSSVGMPVNRRHELLNFYRLLSLCNNYPLDQYNYYMQIDINYIYAQVLRLLEYHKLGTLSTAMENRIMFLDKVLSGAFQGYSQFLNKDVIDYVRSITLADGSCGLATDTEENRQALTGRCLLVMYLKYKLDNMMMKSY